jgi:hypothetical protein
MISTKEYNKPLKVGDLIWFHKDNPDAYATEDMGYINDIYVVKGLKKYNVIWLRMPDSISHTEETKQSIKDMPNSYIFPVL